MDPSHCYELSNAQLRGVAKSPTPSFSSASTANDWRRNTSITVSELYDHYRSARENHRSKREVERIFGRYILPFLGTYPVALVDRTLVTELIDDVATAGSRPTPVMARAVVAQLSAFFSWAVARLAFLADNPCRLAARPRKPLPRSRVLSDRELRDLWSVLDHERLPWNIAIKLILLTGLRRGEIFEAEWAEFDLGGALFTLPASRSKNGRAHRVPLSSFAIELITQIPRISETKVFPARGRPGRGASGFSKAMKRINEAMPNGCARFTIQDLRRTVATGLQRLDTRLEVTEAILNHVSGSRAGIVGVYQLYQFEEEKRVALERWAAKLARLIQRRPMSGERQCPW